MAVNIDTVYQRVLALANKEQRGYITPQEFNLHANQAQMNIFEQYFYDTHQFQATQKGNSTEYSDMLDLLAEKISPFEKYKVAVSMSGNTGTLATDLYRLGTVFYAVGGTTDVEVERVEKNDFAYIENSPLAAPTEKRPVYSRTSETTIKTFPSATITSNVTHNYIAKPTKCEWAYVVVNEKALYNGNEAVNFELHASEEESLVINILELSGITINKQGLVQVAANMEAKNLQQEKQ